MSAFLAALAAFLRPRREEESPPCAALTWVEQMLNNNEGRRVHLINSCVEQSCLTSSYALGACHHLFS